MPGSITAGDFAQLDSMRLGEDRARQAALLGSLSDYARRQQQQQQFDAQLAERATVAANELAQRKSERAASQGLAERQLQMNKDYQDWLMKQPGKVDEKKNAQAQNFALQALVDGVNADGSLDVNSEAFKEAHPLVQQTLLAAATKRQQELKPALDRKLAALKIANQATRMEKVAEGIGDTTTESDRGLEKKSPIWWPFNWWPGQDSAAPDPQAIAKDLKSKAAALRTANKALLDEAGLTQVPETGHYKTQFPTWYKSAVGRQLQMATPIVGTGNAPPEATVSPTDAIDRRLQIMQNGTQPIGTMPATVTGTMLPQVVHQGGYIYQLTPDGRYVPAGR